LVEEIRNHGETKELRDEVVELGTRYGIVTPYTSYLATDGTFEMNARDSRGMVVAAPRAEAKMRVSSGADAVQMSVQQNAMKENKSLGNSARKKDAEEQVIVRNTDSDRFVANRNFYRQANIWIDSDFKSEQKLPETNLKFASDEYFDLVRREKGLAQYLAIGEEVVVVWKNRVYRVTK